MWDGAKVNRKTLLSKRKISESLKSHFKIRHSLMIRWIL
jgi:hypothetical protein